eukprot:1433497-Rhodomonas_salina.1
MESGGFQPDGALDHHFAKGVDQPVRAWSNPALCQYRMLYRLAGSSGSILYADPISVLDKVLGHSVHRPDRSTGHSPRTLNRQTLGQYRT